MKVKELITALQGMNQEVEVGYVWDGNDRSDADEIFSVEDFKKLKADNAKLRAALEKIATQRWDGARLLKEPSRFQNIAKQALSKEG